jgi:hypothetical protein
MAYDTILAQRVKAQIGDKPGFAEKVMFGGIGFMLHGNMACGVYKDDLIVRVGAEAYDDALRQPHAKVFDFTGRPMRGWVMVSPEGTVSDEDLQRWVMMGVDYSASLPKK